MFVMVALIGLGIRLPKLGARPMHTDEAINGYVVGRILAGEAFTYDPEDRHGPALAAVAVPLVKLHRQNSFSDLTESGLRLTPVLAGTATILLFGAAVEMFGFLPCLIAALLFATCPLPVYYDRYFIHESLFVFATFGLILSCWAMFYGGSIRHAAVAGICAALMMACKETSVLHWFDIAAAGLLFWAWNRRREGLDHWPAGRAVLAATVPFLVVALALFTWFGRDWGALPELFQAIPNFISRAGGEGHQKPFWYYGHLLAGGWSGGMLCVLACLGLFVAVRRRDRSPFAFLAYYGLFIAVIYSLIPYKTPWLALNLWLPLTLFAGKAVESLWRFGRKRVSVRISVPAVCLLAGVAAALIAYDTRRRVFVSPADENNPYAYAQTSEDLLGLPVELRELVRQNGLKAPRIAVIASDAWPLPWYLRHFSAVGFWQPGQQVGQADFYVTSTDAAEQYRDRLRDFRPEFFGSRPGVLILLWSPAPK